MEEETNDTPAFNSNLNIKQEEVDLEPDVAPPFVSVNRGNLVKSIKLEDVRSNSQEDISLLGTGDKTVCTAAHLSPSKEQSSDLMSSPRKRKMFPEEDAVVKRMRLETKLATKYPLLKKMPIVDVTRLDPKLCQPLLDKIVSEFVLEGLLDDEEDQPEPILQEDAKLPPSREETFSPNTQKRRGRPVNYREEIDEKEEREDESYRPDIYPRPRSSSGSTASGGTGAGGGNSSGVPKNKTLSKILKGRDKHKSKMKLIPDKKAPKLPSCVKCAKSFKSLLELDFHKIRCNGKPLPAQVGPEAPQFNRQWYIKQLDEYKRETQNQTKSMTEMKKNMANLIRENSTLQMKLKNGNGAPPLPTSSANSAELTRLTTENRLLNSRLTALQQKTLQQPSAEQDPDTKKQIDDLRRKLIKRDKLINEQNLRLVQKDKFIEHEKNCCKEVMAVYDKMRVKIHVFQTLVKAHFAPTSAKGEAMMTKLQELNTGTQPMREILPKGPLIIEASGRNEDDERILIENIYNKTTDLTARDTDVKSETVASQSTSSDPSDASMDKENDERSRVLLNTIDKIRGEKENWKKMYLQLKDKGESQSSKVAFNAIQLQLKKANEQKEKLSEMFHQLKASRSGPVSYVSNEKEFADALHKKNDLLSSQHGLIVMLRRLNDNLTQKNNDLNFKLVQQVTKTSIQPSSQSDLENKLSQMNSCIRMLAAKMRDLKEIITNIDALCVKSRMKDLAILKRLNNQTSARSAEAINIQLSMRRNALNLNRAKVEINIAEVLSEVEQTLNFKENLIRFFQCEAEVGSSGLNPDLEDLVLIPGLPFADDPSSLSLIHSPEQIHHQPSTDNESIAVDNEAFVEQSSVLSVPVDSDTPDPSSECIKMDDNIDHPAHIKLEDDIIIEEFFSEPSNLKTELAEEENPISPPSAESADLFEIVLPNSESEAPEIVFKDQLD